MKLSILAGATSQSVNIFIRDSSSTTGGGLTGLVFNSASLVAYYTHAGTNATATSITLATLAAVNSAYSSGGFKELDATNMPGWYRFDIPNACLAISKGRSVAIHLKGATNMAPTPLEIELTAWDNQDSVRAGLTALPNAAAEASGGLYTRGTGAGQINQAVNGTINGNVTHLLGTAWLTPGTAGTPDVNVKLWNALATVALPLVPTVAGRTLDVSAGGEAGVDWANVGSPTTSLNLSGTTIATTQKVDVETIKTNAVVNGGTITFPTNSTLASTINITAATGVDITKILGTAISTPATAGILDVNLKNIANAAVSTSTAQLGVNVVNIKGSASAGAAGYAGVDWGQVANPTTVQGLSGTTIKTATDVETDTQDIQSRLPAALTGLGHIKASVESIQNDTTYVTTGFLTVAIRSGGIVSSSFANDAITALSIADGAFNSNKFGTGFIGSGSFQSGAIHATAIAAGAIREDTYSTSDTSFIPLGIVDQGTAQSATSTTVVIRAASAYGTNTLAGMTIEVFGSTQGYWQTREIASNVTATDTLTVSSAFSVTPSGVLSYKIRSTAASSGSSAPTLQQIIDGIWNAQTSSYVVTGSMGLSLGNAGAASDPWAIIVPGSYPVGTAGNKFGAIYTKTQLITTGNIQVGGAVDMQKGVIYLWRGADYTGAQVLSFTSDSWPDLTGASVNLYIGSTGAIPGVIVDGENITVAVSSTITGGQALKMPPNTNQYDAVLLATLSGGAIFPLATAITIMRGPVPAP